MIKIVPHGYSPLQIIEESRASFCGKKLLLSPQVMKNLMLEGEVEQAQNRNIIHFANTTPITTIQFHKRERAIFCEIITITSQKFCFSRPVTSIKDHFILFMEGELL